MPGGTDRISTALRRVVPQLSSAEKAAGLARGVVLATVFCMLEMEALAGVRPWAAQDLLVLLGLGYVVVTTCLELSDRVPERLQLPFLVADVLLITGVIYLAGGVESEYYPLYYLPILQASVRLNFRDAVSTSMLSAALYAVLGCTTGFDVHIPTTAYLRVSTFGGSAIFMAAFFALLMRETRAHRQKSLKLALLLDKLRRNTDELAAANEKLRVKNLELETTSRELTEAQGRLVASEKLASLGQLAASVAHELRNPLGGIKNAAYALRRKLRAPDPAIATLLGVIEQEIDNSDRIISSLLNFCRSEPVVWDETDVNACVRDALSKVDGHQGIEVTACLADGLPPVLGDASQLQLVLKNLTSNAVEAMPDGGRLEVSTDAHDGCVRVVVRDTGAGIGAEELGRVFEPLFTTKARGIGLGLVICKTFVERHGGAIAVASQPGKGTSFTVSLPEGGSGANGPCQTGPPS